jgi:methionyl-tRNA formyltransferase
MPPGPDLLVARSPQGLGPGLAGYEPDVVVAYGVPWRLPASVLRLPRLGVLNVHPSLLPRHRGPMPVHWAVRHGDAETGVTVHWMDEAFDSGPIVAQHGGIPLPDDLAGDVVFEQVRATIRALVPEALALVDEGFAGRPQDESRASFEGVMGPESAVIDWSRPARDVHNLVRAYRFGVFAVPGPLAVVRGRWVSVLRTSTQPGSGVRMRCGDGLPLWVMESLPVPARDLWLASS